MTINLTAFDSLVYTAGGHPAVYASVSMPFFFIGVLSVFKSFLSADIYRYTERVRIDLKAVKMRLKESFASHRAQHTASTERSGIIADIYKLLHIPQQKYGIIMPIYI